MPWTNDIIISRQLYFQAFGMCRALHNGSVEWQLKRIELQRQRELNTQPNP